MVDRVYKRNVPEMKRKLESLRSEFAKLDTRTDWVTLRIDPLLKHAESLQRSLAALESQRLSTGVVLLHSDLVYLKTNVEGLKSILESEKRKAAHRKH